MSKSVDEMIAVMEASKTKEIECANLGQNDWSLCQLAPCWDWMHCDYRVRPQKPRRVWVAHDIESSWLLKQADSTLSNATEYIELTPDVRKALGL